MLTHYFKKIVGIRPDTPWMTTARQCAHVLTSVLVVAMVAVRPETGYGSVLLAIELGVLPSLVWALRKGTLSDMFDLLGWAVLLSPFYFLIAWFGKHLLA